MAGNTQPYLFDPRGDGVRGPIRQTAIHNPNGLLLPATAAKLWKRRHAAPKPFARAIKSLPVYSSVAPSAFSQYGRGRPGIGLPFPPPFFGGGADPLKLSIGRGRRRLAPRILPTPEYAPTFGGNRRRKVKRGRASLLQLRSVVNPGSV